MRKRKTGRKFSRKKDQRKALLKGLAANLIERGRIKTTEAKAKEARPFVEKLITRAKKGDLAARRAVLGSLPAKTAKRLVDKIAPRYKKRKGGYTRIIKLGLRKSDGAKMAIIELVE